MCWGGWLFLLAWSALKAGFNDSLWYTVINVPETDSMVHSRSATWVFFFLRAWEGNRNGEPKKGRLRTAITPQLSIFYNFRISGRPENILQNSMYLVRPAYQAACKVEYQPLNRSNSQLTYWRENYISDTWFVPILGRTPIVLPGAPKYRSISVLFFSS